MNNNTQDLMIKTRWKHGNHSIGSDISIIVFKEELNDLYTILKKRHFKKLLIGTDTFELKMLMDSLTHYLGVLQKLPSGKRNAFEADRLAHIEELKKVYKILNITY